MSNHSSEYAPELLELLKAQEEANLGPTNQFPEEKLTPNDEGEIKFAIGRAGGKVVINFNSPVHWLGMTPKQAQGLAKILLKQAKKILKRGGKK